MWEFDIRVYAYTDRFFVVVEFCGGVVLVVVYTITTFLLDFCDFLWAGLDR
jgi:hypothetical protein